MTCGLDVVFSGCMEEKGASREFTAENRDGGRSVELYAG